MCSPEVLATVQAEISRRRALGLAGAVMGGVMLQSFQGAAAQDASPVASPEAVPSPPEAPVYLPSGFTTVLDLTYTATPDFPLFPGTPPFTIETFATVANDAYYSNNLSHNEHTATHMDAPAHFIADGWTADLIPVQQLIAPLVVIDISERAASDPDAAVTVDDITAWEAANGPLPEGAFVAMYSGWAVHLGDPAAYINLDADGVQHYPGFSDEASAYLVSERTISGAGVDTLSLDPGFSAGFESHINFLGASKYGIENLANLEQVPTTGAYIFVGGPKTLGASGGWVRAIAVW
jgi:kynurenine formamidase